VDFFNILRLGGPLAQLVEQLTLNQRAVGSTPTRPTISFTSLPVADINLFPITLVLALYLEIGLRWPSAIAMRR
jgi:hypothetical protein